MKNRVPLMQNPPPPPKKKMEFETILEKVRKVNKILSEAGLNLDEMDAFWNDCIKNAKNQHLTPNT